MQPGQSDATTSGRSMACWQTRSHRLLSSRPPIKMFPCTGVPPRAQQMLERCSIATPVALFLHFRKKKARLINRCHMVVSCHAAQALREMREQPDGRRGDEFGMKYEVVVWKTELPAGFADVLKGDAACLPFWLRDSILCAYRMTIRVSWLHCCHAICDYSNKTCLQNMSIKVGS